MKLFVGNIFATHQEIEFRYYRSRHDYRTVEEDQLRFAEAIHVVWNAMGHVLNHYEDQSSMNVWRKDTGDYYAVRILEAMQLLMSQGKEEQINNEEISKNIS